MSVYKYIFDFIRQIIGIGQGYSKNLIGFTFEIGNVSITLDEWICHTLTIVIICLIVYFFIRLTIWFFKQGANLFKW